MQNSRKIINGIMASWALAGFWFLALVGMSVLSDTYEGSRTDAFALGQPGVIESAALVPSAPDRSGTSG